MLVTLQLSFPVKTWSVRGGDVRVVSRLITFGMPALAFYEAMPHPSVDMREQFADLFTVLQVHGKLACSCFYTIALPGGASLVIG